MIYKEGIIILTEKGKNELKSPDALKLEERSLLVMVDGSSTGDQLMQKARGYPNARQILEKLINEDYLSVSGSGEVQNQEVEETVRSEMKQTMIDILGAQAQDVMKKLETAPLDKPALLLAIKQVKQMVYLTIDEKKAGVLEESLKKIVEKYLK